MWVPGRDASVSVEEAQPDAEMAAREELTAELAAMRTQQAEFLRLRTQLERMQVGTLLHAPPPPAIRATAAIISHFWASPTFVAPCVTLGPASV